MVTASRGEDSIGKRIISGCPYDGILSLVLGYLVIDEFLNENEG